MREMKASKIDFVDSIPRCWDEKPIRFLFEQITEKNQLGKITKALKFTYGTIIPKTDFDADEDDYVANTILSYTIVAPGTIMINCLNLNYDFVSQRIGLVKDVGVITSAYLAIKSKDTEVVMPEFANYQLKYFDSIKAFHNMGTGVRKTLDFNELGKKYFMLPCIAEQHRIVNFLDKECAKIDSIYTDVEKQIGILEQYKRSLITEAVTRGINDNVEMIDSNIPWIGLIPLRWNIDKIKYYFRRNEKKNPGNQQVLSVYREYGVIPKDSRDDNHNVTSEDVSKYKYVKPGYLVINKMKAWQGSMGISDYEGIVSPAYFIFEFSNDSFEKKYVHYLLRSCYKDEFRRISGGIREGQWDLSPEGFLNTPILIPPLQEQQEIVAYIDKKCAEIESIIADKKKQLDVLESYKKSIIYEYVTGKKEVV